MIQRKFDTKIINGKPLVDSLELLSKMTRVSKKISDSHLEENEKNWVAFNEKNRFGYIENQHDLEDFHFGSYNKTFQKWFMGEKKFCAARNSCEVVAVYNALLNMKLVDEEHNFPKILNYFEKNATILKGYFGTSFSGIIKFFKRNGFEYKWVCGKNITREKVDEIEANFETYLFMSYNNIENIVDMIHTMCVTKEEKGFFIHNAFNGLIYFTSLYDAVVKYNEVNGWKSRPIIVMGVNRPIKEEKNEKDQKNTNNHYICYCDDIASYSLYRRRKFKF